MVRAVGEHWKPPQDYRIKVSVYRTKILGRKRFRAVVHGFGVGMYSSAPKFKGATFDAALKRAQAWCNNDYSIRMHRQEAREKEIPVPAPTQDPEVFEVRYDPEKEWGGNPPFRMEKSGI